MEGVVYEWEFVFKRPANWYIKYDTYSRTEVYKRRRIKQLRQPIVNVHNKEEPFTVCKYKVLRLFDRAYAILLKNKKFYVTELRSLSFYSRTHTCMGLAWLPILETMSEAFDDKKEAVGKFNEMLSIHEEDEFFDGFRVAPEGKKRRANRRFKVAPKVRKFLQKKIKGDAQD